MYADDTTIYCTGPDVEHVTSNLNSVMEQITLWSMNDKLIFHPAKTEATILKKTPFVGPFPPIRFCSGFVNIEKVKNSYSKKVSALRRMRHLPKYVLQDIYFKTVISCVTKYAIGSVWGNCSTLLLQSMNSIHARAYRIINNVKSTNSDSATLNKAKWLPIDYLYNRRILLLMFKVFYDLEPQPILDLF